MTALHAVEGGGGKLLTPTEVANFLRVKLRRVYDLVAARRLRAIRVGQQLRFRPEDIARFLDANATE